MALGWNANGNSPAFPLHPLHTHRPVKAYGRDQSNKLFYKLFVPEVNVVFAPEEEGVQGSDPRGEGSNSSGGGKREGAKAEGIACCVK